MDINPAILVFLIIGLLAVLVLSIKWPFAFTAIIIIINERFFGILPYKIGEYDLVRQAAGPVLLILAIGIQVIFRAGHFRSGLNRVGAGYLPIVLAIIGVVTFSTLWGGVFIYHQSLRSLIFQPAVFSYYFFYVYLSFFSPDKKQILRFLGFVVIAAIAISVLLTIDARIFHAARIFKYAAQVGERVGLLRIVIFATGIIWAYYYSLASADEDQYPTRRKIVFGLSALFLLSALVFILIDRQNMFFCFLTTGVIAFSMKMWKKFIVAWVMILLLLFIIAKPDFSFEKSAMGKLVSMTNTEARTSEGSSIGTRFKAMDFYYKYFKNTYGLGFGVLGARPEYQNPVSRGLMYGYNLNDLSLAGIIFQFGIPGLVVIILTAWKMFKDTGRILRTRDPALRSITRGIRYTLLHLVIVFPLTTFLFYAEKAVYFALMFFLVERLGSIVDAEMGAAA